MSFEINTNRLIKIYRTGSTVENYDNSWKTNFSRILKNFDSISNARIISGQAESFDTSYGVDLLMDALPKYQTANNYNTPIDGLLSGLDTLAKVVDIGSAAVNLINALKDDTVGDTTKTSSTFMPWSKNLLAWNGTKDFKFNLTFKFAMGQYGLWNAKDEVFNPILNLIAPTLPQHINGYSMSGPYPNSIGLISNLIQKGIDTYKGVKNGSENSYSKMISKAWGQLKASAKDGAMAVISEGAEFLGTVLEALSLATFDDFTYTVKFGDFLTVQKVIITDSSWNFSNEVDQDGWPIAGDVTLSCESIIPIAMTSSGDYNMTVRFGK